MTTLKRLLAVAIGFFVALQVPQSVAAPVTISAGQSAILSLYYRGDSPAPPYYSVVSGWEMSGFYQDGEVDSGVITVFEGLNGTGNPVFSNYWDDISYLSGFGSRVPGLVDGDFSVVFRSTAGAVTISIDSFWSTMTLIQNGQYVNYNLEREPDVLIVEESETIPEPTGLLLLGSGLFALIAMRRKAGKSI